MPSKYIPIDKLLTIPVIEMLLHAIEMLLHANEMLLHTIEMLIHAVEVLFRLTNYSLLTDKLKI